MKNITKIIATTLIIAICAIIAQSYPTGVSDSIEIDADVILPDGIPTDFYLKNTKVVAGKPESIPEVEAVSKLNYEDLQYNETTPENVQEFLDYIPPCPWYSDTTSNMCSLNARYITLEAKEHGLNLGECTVVDTDTVRVKITLISGHRVNVFEYDGTKYFTTNLCKAHSDVVTMSELHDILHDLMGLDRIGTKDYKWDIER